LGGGALNIEDQLPQSELDLQKFIDLQVSENIHLDYKRTDALTNSKWKSEIAKDVSAFANSDGGILIYGIEEDANHNPSKIDRTLTTGKLNKETIEQVINSGVAPRIHGVRIVEISLGEGSSAFAIQIPKAFRPHQETHGHRYYKRFNFQSVSLHDFEIEDLRRREEKLRPLVRVSVQIMQRFMVVLKIENPESFVAQDVKLTFEPPIPWRNGPPRAVREGIKYLSPSQEISFNLDSTHQILNPESGYPETFEVRAKYLHPLLDREVEDSYFIDLASWAGSKLPTSELSQFSDKLAEGIGKLVDELKAVKNSLNEINRISAPTGLALSVSTLKDLKSLLQQRNEDNKIDPRVRDFGPAAIQELFDIEFHTATRIWEFFQFHESDKALDALFPDDPNLVKQIRSKLFISGKMI
jgi:Putative DNA-binding domain